MNRKNTNISFLKPFKEEEIDSSFKINIKEDYLIKKPELFLKITNKFNFYSLIMFNILTTELKIESKIYSIDLMALASLFKNKVKSSVKNNLIKSLHDIIKNSYISFNNDLEASYVSIISKIYLDKKNNIVYFKINTDFIELYSEYSKRKYLLYNLKNITNLSSVYMLRLYEKIKYEYRKTKSNNKYAFICSLQEIRETLSISDTYDYYKIKKRFISKAIDDFEECTDIKIERVTEIKDKNKVKMLDFYIKLSDTNNEHRYKVIDIIRNKYAGNGKKFIFNYNNNKEVVFYGIDSKGYMFKKINSEYIDVDKIESLRVFKAVNEYYGKIDEIRAFINEGLCFEDLYLNNISLMHRIYNSMLKIKEEKQ